MERKPRSCLSDALQHASRKSLPLSASFRAAPTSRSDAVKPAAACSSGEAEIGKEIAAILSQRGPADRSSIFGCSPPLRACNPGVDAVL
ncbi:hypothetical protein WJX72_004916 [[Myrmecia] bisecta]|uniref:Uncharacterized protein n=1 Tax=[Myrmecia] bisecta TaxID=41462 RepID=A0AAW1R7G7_9CHLO